MDAKRTARFASAEPDPMRITFDRKQKKKDNEKGKERKSITRRGEQNVGLPGCVSMWKNPTSKIIPLEMRILHNRFRDVRPEVNISMFTELKSSLDRVEEFYSEEEDEECEDEERWSPAEEFLEEEHIKE